MWPRSRRNKESYPPTPYPESSTPVSARTARHLGSPAIFGFAAEASSQLDAEFWAFNQLRLDTHAGMRSEYTNRMATDPTPTAQELAIGMYAENLEPQVRSATFQMREKGYATCASGFSHGQTTWRTLGIEGEDVPVGTYAPTSDPVNMRAQIMDFSQGFLLDQTVINQLAEVGAEAIYHPADGLIHRIGFVPETPDLSVITASWDSIASTLPDMGTPVPAAEVFSDSFYDWGATTMNVDLGDFGDFGSIGDLVT